MLRYDYFIFAYDLGDVYSPRMIDLDGNAFNRIQ